MASLAHPARAGLLALALALVVSACADDAPLRWTAPPRLPADTQSVLLVFEGAAQPAVFAAAAAGGELTSSISHPLSSAEAQASTRVVAYAYAQPLDALGLAHGRVVERAGRSCALDAPLEAQQVDLPGSGSWRAAPPQLPADLRTVLYGGGVCERPDLCLDFRAERIAIDEAEQWFSMVALDDEVLLADVTNRFFSVDVEGRVQRREGLDARPGQALARTADGEVWFAGAGGRLERGPLQGPFIEVEAGTSTTSLIVAVADSSAQDTLLLAFEDLDPDDERKRVEVHWQHDGVWRRVHSAEVFGGAWWESDIAWIDEDRAVLVYGGLELLVFRAPRVTAFPLTDLDLIEHVAGGVVVGEDGAVYVGARAGTVLRAEAPYEAWAPLGSNPVPRTIQAMSRLGETILVGATRGFVGQHHPAGRECDGRAYHGSNSHLLSVLKGHVFVAGGGPDVTDTGYLVRMTRL